MIIKLELKSTSSHERERYGIEQRSRKNPFTFTLQFVRKDNLHTKTTLNKSTIMFSPFVVY